MKRAIRLVVLILTMVLVSSISFASSMDVKIEDKQVDFNRINNGQPVGEPFIEGNRTYLPVRVISEDLGYKVDWTQATQTATITKGKTIVEITIGKSQALVNGVKKNIDVQNGVVSDTKARIVGGRTYVPVRFIAEAMGDKVDYRQPSNSSVANRTVYINCTDLPVETPSKPVTPPVVKPPVVTPPVMKPSVVVPEFVLVPHTRAGDRDYKIFLQNFKKYEGTGAKFTTSLISHQHWNSYQCNDPYTGELYVIKDDNKFYANKMPLYYQSTFSLRSWKADPELVDIGTGKQKIPPKVGEIMTWRVTIDMNSGSEVYELEIPYRNFTKNVTTSGKRIK